MRYLFIFCLFILTASSNSAVYGQNDREKLLTYCHTKDSNTKVVCDIRFSNPLNRPIAKDITVKWNPSGKTVPATYNDFNPNRDSTAWLFLIDRTKSMISGKNSKTTKAIKQDITTLINNIGNHRSIGIYTFADDMKELAPVGSPKSTLLAAIKKLKLNGTSTGLFKQTEQALKKLDEVKGVKRKALVVLSDGFSEETEKELYKNNVLSFAKQKGIVIYGIGYKWSAQPLALDSINRLANETSGPKIEVDAGTRRIPQSFMDFFYERMENGGTAEFEAQAGKDGAKPSFTLFANLGDRVLKKDTVLTAPPPERGMVHWWNGLPDKKKYIYGGLGAGAFSLLLALLWLTTRRRGRGMAHDDPITEDFINAPLTDDFATAATDQLGGGMGAGAPETLATAIGAGGAANVFGSAAETQILSSAGGDKTYAWFDRVGSSERLPVQKTVVNIGRHDDNDVSFAEDSVHRRHATMHITPQREFIITNLAPDDGNVVQVNGNKVTGNTKLNDGDRVKLGVVELIFQIQEL